MFKIINTDRVVTEVEGMPFDATVQGEEFHFFVHVADNGIELTVSHLESGRRFGTIAHAVLARWPGDWVGAAKATIQTLIAQHGEARVRSVLASAVPLS